MTDLVKEASAKKAQVILLPELFENIYFCTYEKDEYFALAKPLEGHPTIQHFSDLCQAAFRCRHPVLVLRARWPVLLQQPRDDRR